MTVLDAFAVIAYMRREPAEHPVEQLLSKTRCVTTAVGFAEVVDRMVRLEGAETDQIAFDLAELGLSTPAPVDRGIALIAGTLRSRHYSARRRSVSMADCVAAAVAQQRQEPLATSDPHLLDMCHEQQITTIPLPTSDGSVWTPPG